MHEILVDRVMKMLLNGEDEVLEILRKQYGYSKIKSIESSPVGFFVNYEVSNFPINCEKYKSNFQIGDVYGSVYDIKLALGFLLYIEKGVIVMLEGYTNIIDKWPNDDNIISLSYITDSSRNYQKLKRNWTY